MGSTNLRASLGTKMGHWAAELKEHEDKIVEIESLFEQLPTISARAQRLKKVLDCAGIVMKEIDPEWRAEKVKPVKAFVHKSPVRLGQIAKLSLDVLRESSFSLTSREIAKEVMARDGVTNADPKAEQRVVNSVDASLRAKLDIVVTNDGGYPRRWSILSEINQVDKVSAA